MPTKILRDWCGWLFYLGFVLRPNILGSHEIGDFIDYMFWRVLNVDRFCPRSLLTLDAELIDKIPGRQTDRKTPLGELNWIFTAITDTIAWNVLPRGEHPGFI